MTTPLACDRSETKGFGPEDLRRGEGRFGDPSIPRSPPDSTQEFLFGQSKRYPANSWQKMFEVLATKTREFAAERLFRSSL
jgi:hypothetical protein